MSVTESMEIKILQELDDGESIIWSEMAVPEPLKPVNIFLYILGVCWVLYFSYRAYNSEENFSVSTFLDFISILFHVALIAAGIIITFSPLISARNLRRTAHVITDRRLIMFKRDQGLLIKSLYPEQLVRIYRKERKNNIGDVIFTTNNKLHYNDGIEDGFIGVRNPIEVEKMVKELADS